MRQAGRVKLHKSGHRLSRGQGLIETALIVTLLMMIVASIVEFGFMLTAYMAMQDAVRNASRYSSDGQYNYTDNIHNCATTKDFYRQTACLFNQELSAERPLITMTIPVDDLIISVFSVQGAGGSLISPTVMARYPNANGWSMAEDWGTSRTHISQISTSYINSMLAQDAPSTGFLLVEAFYTYHQKFNLPWIRLFIPTDVVMHTYSLMPLVSAEPTTP
jgi:hypothetical protein